MNTVSERMYAEREREQWFVVLALGVDDALVDVPEPPASPTAADVLP